MRDNQNYLSKYMLYNINVTIMLQYIGSYALFFKRKLLITRFARDFAFARHNQNKFCFCSHLIAKFLIKSRIPLRNSQVNLVGMQEVAQQKV